jgi:hypothetical protein
MSSSDDEQVGRSQGTPAQEPTDGSDERGRGLRRRLQRLLDRRELAEDTREVIGGVLEMSDRAKTEAVRLVAREVRNYLEELKIKDDLLSLATKHSLEIQLSLKLKPLVEAAVGPAEPQDAEPEKG